MDELDVMLGLQAALRKLEEVDEFMAMRMVQLKLRVLQVSDRADRRLLKSELWSLTVDREEVSRQLEWLQALVERSSDRFDPILRRDIMMGLEGL